MEGAEGESLLQSTASSVAHALQLLGDPSGHQDSEYWDGWFDTVCRRQDHRSFEWYCSAEEVLRVVNHYCCNGEIANQHLLAMIHPGSGTSLVPLKLRDAFPASRQVVVDISSVAMEEVRQVHDKHQQNAPYNGDASPIEYVVADLLQQKKPRSDDGARDAIFSTSTFDCWIDKGFVDAIFSKKNAESNRIQSAKLFQESCRILKPHVGFALFVSLAEDHSVQIIIENWLSHLSCWQRTLDVWDLEPISGELPPFGFILTKADETSRTRKEGNFKLRWHKLDNGDIEELSLCKDIALNAVQEYIQTSRQRLTQRRQKASALSTVRRVLVTLEIKPSDAEVDLVALSQRLRTEAWEVDSGGARRLLRPQWQPFSDHDPSELHRIVPIGFGISKLLLKCVILLDDLDDLRELIKEWDDGLVQSVDVDWQGLIPVGDICDLMRQGSK